MNWDHVQIKKDNGENAKAQAPIIISASRSTDIPAFYSEWFFERLKRGYLVWKNPFNGIPINISFAKTRLIVFWTKNPKPVIKHLDYLKELGINYYFQFTLNNYDRERIEPGLPSLGNRIETFVELSEKIGKDKVIWRFDPYILSKTTSVDELLNRTKSLGNVLQNYTNKFVFSFADIKSYKKVQNNLNRESFPYIEFNEKTMNEIALGIMKLNKNWNFEIGTCAEKINLDQYGISHNKCIDDDLIIKQFYNDSQLMNFLGVNFEKNTLFGQQINYIKSKKIKDKGQRIDCGCIMSKDIGQYNTCPHGCIYCYANTSKETAIKNYSNFKGKPSSEMIVE